MTVNNWCEGGKGFQIEVQFPSTIPVLCTSVLMTSYFRHAVFYFLTKEPANVWMELSLLQDSEFCVENGTDIFRVGVFQWVVFFKGQEFFFWVTPTNHLVPLTSAVPPAVAGHLFFLWQSDSRTVTLASWCYGCSLWNGASVTPIQNWLPIPYRWGLLRLDF